MFLNFRCSRDPVGVFLGFLEMFSEAGAFRINPNQCPTQDIGSVAVHAPSPGQPLTGGGELQWRSAGRPTYVAPTALAMTSDPSGRLCVQGSASGAYASAGTPGP